MTTIFGKPNPHYPRMKRNKRSLYGFKSGLTKRLVAASQNNAIKKVVKSEIIKMAETKNSNYSSSFAVLNYSSANWASINLIPISPYPGYLSILQGVEQGERVGNSIRIKKQNVKLVLYPQPYTALTNIKPQPMEVIIWVFGIKNNDVIPPNLTDFFMDGNTSASPTGRLPDLIQDVNKDIYILYKKITRKLGYSNIIGSGNSVNDQYYANNDFKLNHIVNINTTKYLPTNVVWNDTSTIPHTKGVFFAIQVIHADGTATGPVDVPANAYMEINTYYTDL